MGTKESSSENPIVITCECGFQIPVVGDMEAVGQAIDSHTEEHLKSDGETISERIHDFLFDQLFKKISQLFK